jgi:hypothetical protein
MSAGGLSNFDAWIGYRLWRKAPLFFIVLVLAVQAVENRGYVGLWLDKGLPVAGLFL